MKISILAAFAFVSSAFAANQIQFTSSQITCSSCAKKITRVLEKDSRVKRAVVDVDAQTVTVELKKGQKLSDEELKTVLAPTQYPVEGIKHL